MSGAAAAGPAGDTEPGPAGEPEPGPPSAAADSGDVSAIGTAAAAALAAGGFACGVTLVTVADGRDDIGTTVSSFCPVSDDPPLVAVCLLASSYAAELLTRRDLFAVTVLAAGQRALAGRFAAAGRPGARLLLAGMAHQRGTVSGALIAGGGLAGLECRAEQRVPAGDHLMVIGRVLAVPYVTEDGDPLIRFQRRYTPLTGANQG